MKHEKAILIALAYIIGFITAFIAFGLDYSQKIEYKHQAMVSAAVSTKAVEKDDGLYVVTDEVDRILSAKTENQVAKEGFHKSIITAQVSPTGRYIHYCSQVDMSENFCLNYVYDLNSDSIYRVKTATGEHVASLVTAKGESWIGDNTLLIEKMRSVSEKTPWKLQ